MRLAIAIVALAGAGCPATDLLLEEDRRAAERRVEEALAAGDIDGAHQTIHAFAQEFAAAENRGVAMPAQIRRSRSFIDASMQRIHAARENQTASRIEEQVAEYLGEMKFGQARYFVRTNLHALNPSENLERRLLQELDRIEEIQIDTIERLAVEDLARGAEAMAQARVALALDSPDFSRDGQQRLMVIQQHLFAQSPAPPSAAPSVVAAPSPAPTPSPPTSPPRVPSPVEIPQAFGLEFAWVPAGDYIVGSPPTEDGRNLDDVDPETVTVSGFFISTTEVTQEAFRRVMPRTWSEYAAPKIPAHSITFDEAEDYCRRLSDAERRWAFELPTEVEWEIAARAFEPPSVGPIVGTIEDRERFLGTLDDAAFTLQKYATFRRNRVTAGPGQVGRKLANPLGLFDVHGNVAEWCRLPPDRDHWYQGSLLERPIRGGSVQSGFERCRAGARSFEQKSARRPTIGFRIVARSR